MVEFGRDRRSVADRREKPATPFSRYTLSGRRRSIRRGADRKIHLYVDVYGHYVFVFLLLIILLSILDAYFTIIHMDKGAREINPFMNFLLGYGDMPFFVLKYILTALGIVILCIYQSLPMVRAVILFVFIFYLTVFAHHVFLILSGGGM